MRLYLETTVFNYYFDKGREGHEDVVLLFNKISEGKYDAYTSDYTIDELYDAPEPKRSNMLALIQEYNIILLPITEESDHFADMYVSKNIIPAHFRLDGAHIAVASLNNLDYVLSYNFQHINRAKTKLLTERVNREHGYGTVVICTAREVLNDE